MEFSGNTLLGRTIKTIRKSKMFHNIWVSTDDAYIEEDALRSKWF